MAYQKKAKKFNMRVSDENLALFHRKARTYQGNISAMILDAVKQFNDIRTTRKIEVMNALMKFYRQYQDQLSHLGGNFNQAMKRANELNQAGLLDRAFFESEIMPSLTEVKAVLIEIKDYLSDLSDRIR